ncbi:hypothetical protein SSX86_031419 [Deinandra increscens subsp. villosa]|uniref:Sulfotransferase n=1 Tax=Deinandra increscens subsp. villosa TaxID=3103831 RepID=A0AAP0C9X7_9ASTR
MLTSNPSPLPKYLKEDELSEECKTLIPTLPTALGWVHTTLYKYQGFWHPLRQLQGVISCQQHFQSQHKDILLVTTPKSDTTWLKSILFTLINRTHLPPTQQNHPLLSTNPHILLRLEQMGSNSLEQVFEKFCEGVSLYGPFWDHVLSYWHVSVKNPEKICFLTYEEMKEEPEVHLRKLAEFLGCPFSKKEDGENMVEGILDICSFDNLSNLEVSKEGKLPSGENNSAFFRKGEVDDWKNYMTIEMVERIKKICEEKLEGSGLKF